MDEKTKMPGDDAQDERLLKLEESLRRQVFGQDDVKDAVLKALTRKPNIVLTGKTGAGKTAIIEAVAKSIAGSPAHRHIKKPSGGLGDPLAADSLRPHGDIIILDDEITTPAPNPLSKAFERARGRIASIKAGEQAAQACHDGITERMIPMKPLRLKRGFAYLM